MLANAAVFAYPDYRQVFKINRSGYVFSADLVQRQEGEERPLEFTSRIMTVSERNYSITENECLAKVSSEKVLVFYLGSSN